MGKALWIRVGVAVLLAGIVATVWAHESRQSARLKSPAIVTHSPDERRAALAALKTAWAQRPSELTPDNARDEKDFINRTAFFVQKNYRREIGTEASAFYRQVVGDFFARYGSEDILAE
jgi:hypothetical protein